jgi:hypothetical protein
MSMPDAGPDGPMYEMMGNVTTYVYDGNGELIPEDDPRRKRARLVEVEPKPKVEVAYDRSRHVIQIKEPGGKTAEFDDRPVRFLVMDRNPVTKALEPVIIRGEPLYYYLAKEVGGEK